MFGRKRDAIQTPETAGSEQPVRIMTLSTEERAMIAQHRFDELDKLLRASGCATQPDEASLAVNFHTGEHLMIVQVNRVDPRQIKLMMVLNKADGDFARARWACSEATKKQFASKATAAEMAAGFTVTFSLGVYVERLHYFGDSLKAYVDDVGRVYAGWLELMLGGD